MTIAMERILAWKLLPRAMMICRNDINVSKCTLVYVNSRPRRYVNNQALAIRYCTGIAYVVAFAVWLGHEK